MPVPASGRGLGEGSGITELTPTKTKADTKNEPPPARRMPVPSNGRGLGEGSPNPLNPKGGPK